MLHLQAPLLVLFASGIVLQVTVLRHGEWNLYGPTFVALAFALWAVLLISFFLTSPYGFLSAALFATKATWSGIAGVFASMTIYRMFFHRLMGFPGPLGAKISSWWPSTLHGKNWKFYEGMAALHAVHGDFVRIAPDALSVADPETVISIHGPDSKCIKGSFYSIAEPQRNLLMIRNKVEHAKKRRVWDRAFNVKSLNDYEPTVWTYTQHLMLQIGTQRAKSMNIAKWLQFFAFDVMTDLAFGRSFDSTATGKPSRIMEEVEAPVMVFGLFHYVPWVAHFFKHVPFMVAHKAKFDAYLHQLVEERKAMRDARPDCFSHFLDPYMEVPEKERTDQMQKNLIGDAMLLVIAGSGPTAPAVAAILYNLAKRPDLQQQLHEELRVIDFKVGAKNHAQLAKCELLNACIDEALRMHPPIRSGPERMTPPEGLNVGDVHIPGNVRLTTPLWVLQRDSRSFVEPNEFRPERWTSRPDLVLNPSASIPFFGTGTFSCVGKALALLQIRQAFASIVDGYTFTLANKEAADEFVRDTNDYFACFANTLNLVFEAR